MTEEQARGRFFLLTVIRIVAILFVGCGVAIIARKVMADPIIGYAFLVIGAVEFFLIPAWLKSVWRNQQP